MIIALAVVACSESQIGADTGSVAVPWADEVLEAAGDASRAVNGARGLGQTQGSTDVYSLTVDPQDALVVGWSGAVLTDGPGIDLVVFENPFDYGDGNRFMDLVVVSVSPDGLDFVDFPHTYLASDPEIWSSDPDDWDGFAGKTPVLLNEDTNAVDPFDAELSGGDGFDFADLPSGDPVAADILANGAVAVRLISADFPRDPVSNGADIDAVYGRYLVR
jgi:hypothetical protein